MVDEIWKDIDGFIGQYQVSNYGRVKTLERNIYRKDGKLHYIQKEKIIKPNINTKGRGKGAGYYYFNVCKNGKAHSREIHRLVALAFIPNPDNKATVNHKDGIKLNCHVDNLEWATYEENNRHARESGLNQFRRK